MSKRAHAICLTFATLLCAGIWYSAFTRKPSPVPPHAAETQPMATLAAPVSTTQELYEELKKEEDTGWEAETTAAKLARIKAKDDANRERAELDKIHLETTPR